MLSRTSLINALPEHIRARVALVEDALMISEELQGQMPVVNLVMPLRSCGVSDFQFVPPSVSTRSFPVTPPEAGIGENEVQQLAIDMIARRL